MGGSFICVSFFKSGLVRFIGVVLGGYGIIFIGLARLEPDAGFRNNEKEKYNSLPYFQLILIKIGGVKALGANISLFCL